VLRRRAVADQGVDVADHPYHLDAGGAPGDLARGGGIAGLMNSESGDSCQATALSSGMDWGIE
jgi:hypothetical protein